MVCATPRMNGVRRPPRPERRAAVLASERGEFVEIVLTCRASKVGRCAGIPTLRDRAILLRESRRTLTVIGSVRARQRHHARNPFRRAAQSVLKMRLSGDDDACCWRASSSDSSSRPTWHGRCRQPCGALAHWSESADAVLADLYMPCVGGAVAGRHPAAVAARVRVLCSGSFDALRLRDAASRAPALEKHQREGGHLAAQNATRCQAGPPRTPDDCADRDYADVDVARLATVMAPGAAPRESVRACCPCRRCIAVRTDHERPWTSTGVKAFGSILGSLEQRANPVPLSPRNSPP